MNRLKWIVIGALLCLFSEAGAAGKDWVKYVNTLQGTNSSFELSRGNKIGRASCREECRSRWSPYH